jgi:PAS domain S-box-containing protein
MFGSRARWDLDSDMAMAQAVRHVRLPLCISDPNLPDNPIVFANAAFLDLTGYAAEEIIGRNCRVLQGPDTTGESVAAVRRALDDRRVETIEILNYRKDGSRFVNSLQIGPILDEAGRLVFFFGSQLDVTAKREAERRARELADEELTHRLRNIVNVMSVVIRMTAREVTDPGTLSSILTERLRALSDVHMRTILPGGHDFSMRELVQTILLAYSPKGAAQFALSGPFVVIPGHLLSCIALCLHELATNAVKHGALGAETGRVEFDWAVRDATLTCRWHERDGPKVVRPERRGGSKIVSDLIAAAGGSIALRWEEAGLMAEARFPL